MSELVNKVNGIDIIKHPIGVQKIIVGDIHEVTNPITGVTTETGGGTVVYNREDAVQRPWILIAFENGDRCEETEEKE